MLLLTIDTPGAVTADPRREYFAGLLYKHDATLSKTSRYGAVPGQVPEPALPRAATAKSFEHDRMPAGGVGLTRFVAQNMDDRLGVITSRAGRLVLSTRDERGRHRIAGELILDSDQGIVVACD